MLFSLFSYCFLLADICYDIFLEVFKRIEAVPGDVVFNNNIVQEEEFSLLVEWLLVSVAKYLAGDDVNL